MRCLLRNVLRLRIVLLRCRFEISLGRRNCSHKCKELHLHRAAACAIGNLLAHSPELEFLCTRAPYLFLLQLLPCIRRVPTKNSCRPGRGEGRSCLCLRETLESLKDKRPACSVDSCFHKSSTTVFISAVRGRKPQPRSLCCGR